MLKYARALFMTLSVIIMVLAFKTPAYGEYKLIKKIDVSPKNVTTNEIYKNLGKINITGTYYDGTTVNLTGNENIYYNADDDDIADVEKHYLWSQHKSGTTSIRVSYSDMVVSCSTTISVTLNQPPADNSNWISGPSAGISIVDCDVADDKTVGVTNGTTVKLFYNGSWHSIGGPGGDSIVTMAVHNRNAVWAACDPSTNKQGYVYFWNGLSWSQKGSPKADTNLSTAFYSSTDYSKDYPDMDVDSAGTPYISVYVEVSNNNSTRNGYVMKWTGSKWQGLGGVVFDHERAEMGLLLVKSPSEIYAERYWIGWAYQSDLMKWNGSSWNVQYNGSRLKLEDLSKTSSGSVVFALNDSNGNEDSEIRRISGASNYLVASDPPEIGFTKPLLIDRDNNKWVVAWVDGVGKKFLKYDPSRKFVNNLDANRICNLWENSNGTITVLYNNGQTFSNGSTYTAPPTGSISINNGAATTNSTSVVLNLDWSETGVQMEIRNDSSSFTGNWQWCSTPKSWTLSSGYGTKYVYIRFRDADGNISQTYYDTINYTQTDTTPPTGSITIQNSSPTTSSSVVLQLIATDDTGITGVEIRNDNSSFTGNWQAVPGYQYYASTPIWTLSSGYGTKYVYVRYKDGAGNISQTYYDTINYTQADTIPPTINANPSSGTISPGASINITVTDPSGILATYYQWNFESNYTLASNGSSFTVTAPTASGYYTLYIYAYDNSSNYNPTGWVMFSYTVQQPGAKPTVTTNSSVTNKTTSSATAKGNVTSDGGAVITSRGIQYRPSWSGTWTSKSTTGTTGAFSVSLTGLSASTTYYYRAYASNSKGTSYGAQYIFTTSAPPQTVPTVVTDSYATSITSSSATAKGNVTSDGGAVITGRGIQYRPSWSGTWTSKSTTGTTGAFSVSLTGLSASTTYYYRAYASNSKGTSYGAQYSFTTPTILTGISASPNPVSIAKGLTQKLTATANMSDGTNNNVTSAASYVSSNSGIAAVNSSGLITGAAIGTASINITYNGKSTSVSVTVTAPVATNISAEPNPATVNEGKTQQLTVTAELSDGTTSDVSGMASYSSQSTSTATVDNTGKVTGVMQGTTIINISYSGKSTQVNVTVNEGTPPDITFNPEGGIFSGNVEVAIECSDASGLANSRYVWSTSVEKPESGWVDFAPPYTSQTTLKSNAGTWYLHVSSTDTYDNEQWAYKVFSIISSTMSAAVRPTDGVMFMAGSDGTVIVLGKDEQLLSQIQWTGADRTTPDAANIKAVLAYEDGRMLFAGGGGKYQIRNASGQWKAPDTWIHAGKDIQSLSYLYNASGIITGDVLMAGEEGCWQVLKSNGNLGVSGTCSWTDASAAAQGRANGNMVIAGSQGKVKIFKPDGSPLTDQNWTKSDGVTPDTSNIYAVLGFMDKSILFAGQNGKYQLRKPDGTWGQTGNWGHAGESIKALSMLPNGNVLMTGGDGYYQVLDITINADGSYTLSPGEKGRYLLHNTAASASRSDGRILLCGNNWNYRIYKLEPEYTIETEDIESNSVTIKAQWDGKAFGEINGAAVEWGTGGTFTNKTAITGLHTTITGLTAGRTYNFRIKAGLGWPISYTSKTITATTSFPVAVSQFTDRVTAANQWIEEAVDSGQITEEEVIDKGYNRYFPNSEVVCKFVIDPGGADIDRYDISLDVNADNTTGIDTSYIKIVKIDYDGTTQWGYTDNPGPPGGADKPLCGKYDGSEIIEFEIDNPGNKVITVWCKYKFINLDMDSIPAEFRNRVEVTAVSGGDIKALEPTYNTIYLRKAKIEYM